MFPCISIRGLVCLSLPVIIFDDLKNCVLDGRMDGRTDGQTDGQTDGRREVLPDGRWNISRYLMPKKAYTYLYLFKKWIFGNFKTLTDRQTDGRMEGLTDGWTVRWIDSSFWMKGSTKNKKNKQNNFESIFSFSRLVMSRSPLEYPLGPLTGGPGTKKCVGSVKKRSPNPFYIDY